MRFDLYGVGDILYCGKYILLSKKNLINILMGILICNKARIVSPWWGQCCW